MAVGHPPAFGWRPDRTFESAGFRAVCSLKLNISPVVHNLAERSARVWDGTLPHALFQVQRLYDGNVYAERSAEGK